MFFIFDSSNHARIGKIPRLTYRKIHKNAASFSYCEVLWNLYLNKTHKEINTPKHYRAPSLRSLQHLFLLYTLTYNDLQAFLILHSIDKFWQAFPKSIYLFKDLYTQQIQSIKRIKQSEIKLLLNMMWIVTSHCKSLNPFVVGVKSHVRKPPR